MKNSALSALKGFTLIELLVVISIIGILATLIFANFAGVRERGRDAARKSDINNIQKALEIYKSSQATPQYPPSATWRDALQDTAHSGANAAMKVVPHDPKYDSACSSGCWPDYSYTLNATDNLKYTLITCFENASDQQKDSTKDASCSIASFTRTEP